jgi:hypothetical protein
MLETLRIPHYSSIESLLDSPEAKEELWFE